MTARMPTGMDFISARLHGRRSRLAEGARLDELSRLRSIPDLARALFPESQAQTAVELQRELIQDLAREMVDLSRWSPGNPGKLMDWLFLRFQVENLKLLARGFVTRTPLEQIESHLMPLPEPLTLDAKGLVTAENLESFTALIKNRALRMGIDRAAEVYRLQPRAFVIEAALDRAYYKELLARTKSLPWPERDHVMAMVRQDVDTFHTMLVVRGKFMYQMKPDLILSFYLPGAGIHYERFAALVASNDLADVAAKVVGFTIDAVPMETKASAGGAGGVDPVSIEIAAWNRFLRLARALFRRGHMNLGAVVAYIGIRRIELANLITLTEGIGHNIDPDQLRRRLIPRTDLSSVVKGSSEVAHV
jgi:V/A-type H+/Na+-transporting ATPase subunit C